MDSVKNKLVKRKAEKELMDIRTKVKKTNAVEEFIKKEQSKAENEEDFEGDYECPILKDKVGLVNRPASGSILSTIGR